MIVRPEALAYIEKHDILYADGRRASYHRRAYRWMMQEMVKRIGPPARKGLYPLWAWYQWCGPARKKPDLRCSAHIPPGEKGYRLTIKVDNNDILLSDFDEWHFALNNWYLSRNEQEDNDFEAELEKAGVTIKTVTKPEHIQRKIEKSWENVFDLDTPRALDWFGSKEQRSIQATMWTLRSDQIKKIESFTSR